MKERCNMKRVCFTAFCACLLNSLTTLCLWAQGSMTYVSSLSGPSGGSVAVASDSWFAQGFTTGANAPGYSLESVSLLMANAMGNPSGFVPLQSKCPFLEYELRYFS